MPVAVVGGAGSDGKTTVLELISKHLVTQGKEPLVIDANPDQNLASFFGLPEEKEAALALCDEIGVPKAARQLGMPKETL